MRSVTIQLDEDVAGWLLRRASQRLQDASDLIGELLRQKMQTEEDYEAARDRFLSQPPVRLKSDGAYPSRDELHERGVLR